MQEEFEKKVQERVHTFGIPPSPQVWDEVDAVLGKRKHRRIFIGWWILLGLVIAGGGILFYHKDNILHNELNQRPVTTGDTALQNNITKTKPAVAPPSAQKATQTGTPVVSSPNNNQTAGSNAITANTNTKTHFSFAIKNSTKGLQTTPPAITAAQPGVTAAEQKAGSTVTLNDKAVANKQQQAGNQPTTNATPAQQPPNILPGAGLNDAKKPAETAQPAADMQQNKTPAAPPGNNTAPQPITPKTIATKRHQWFFTVAGGTTQTITKSGLFDQFDKSNFSVNPSQNYLALTAPAAYKYAIDKPGTGYHLAAGIAYQYKLSPHWRVTTGAQVAYLSNIQKTGNYIKSSFYVSTDQNFTTPLYSASAYQASYYQGSQAGQTYNVVNKAWQLQVPVNVSYVLNPRSKTKFLLDAGMSLTRTITSEWLIPDTRYEKLYYNRLLLNNTIIGWQAGPSLELYNQIKLGLHYQQSFTTMAKNYVAPKLYWQNISFYAGIPLNINFKKTKK